MPVLSCYVDDRTLAILRRISPDKGMTVEQLAEAAIENAAIAELPGGYPSSGQHFAYDGSRIDTRAIGEPFDLEDRLGEPLMGLDPRVKREHQRGGDRHHRAQVDRLGGQPFHHGLGPVEAEGLKRWIGEEIEREDALGRESTIRPGFYEGDME